MNRSVLLIPVLLLPLLGGCSDDGTATPTATATATAALATATRLATATSLATSTATMAPPPSVLSTATSSPTPTGITACCGDGHLDAGEDCDDGNESGGDGCAANCTSETTISMALHGVATITGGIDFVSEYDTEQAFRIGGATSDSPPPSCSGLGFGAGERPVTQRFEDVATIVMPIPGIACACIRPAVVKRCGGGLIRPPRNACGIGSDCSDDPDVCPFSLCRFAHGAGNVTSGVVGCLGLVDVDYAAYAVDDRSVVTCSREGGVAPPGSALLYTSASTGVIMGNPLCIEDASNANNGPDGIPCSDDDPPASRGDRIETHLLTTGRVLQSVIVAATPALTEGSPTSFEGAPFDCHQLPGTPRFCWGVSDFTAQGSSFVATCVQAEEDG